MSDPRPPGPSIESFLIDQRVRDNEQALAALRDAVAAAKEKIHGRWVADGEQRESTASELDQLAKDLQTLASKVRSQK
jgi:hypothetical protein